MFVRMCVQLYLHMYALIRMFTTFVRVSVCESECVLAVYMCAHVCMSVCRRSQDCVAIMKTRRRVKVTHTPVCVRTCVTGC